MPDLPALVFPRRIWPGLGERIETRKQNKQHFKAMKKANKLLCPDCGLEAIEHSEKDVYRYKGEAYLYNSHFWRCVNGHEFQSGEQLQYGIDQCKAIKEMVNNEKP